MMCASAVPEMPALRPHKRTVAVSRLRTVLRPAAGTQHLRPLKSAECNLWRPDQYLTWHFFAQQPMPTKVSASATCVLHLPVAPARGARDTRHCMHAGRCEQRRIARCTKPSPSERARGVSHRITYLAHGASSRRASWHAGAAPLAQVRPPSSIRFGPCNCKHPPRAQITPKVCITGRMHGGRRTPAHIYVLVSVVHHAYGLLYT